MSQVVMAVGMGELIAQGVEHLLPEAAPVRPIFALRRGRSHESWVLNSGLGRLVGKVAPGPHSSVEVDRLVEHHRLLVLNAPVPPLLAFTAASDVLDARLLVVSRYVEGIDGEEGVRTQPAATMIDAMRATGSALGRLHAVPVDGFGDPETGLGAGPATWSDVVTGRIEALRLRYAGGDAVPDVVRGLTLLGELAGEVSPVVQPAVAHLDLYLPNVLLDTDGRFQMLLDLEHVRWVDPVMDFVKPAMWMLAGRPGWSEAFADGYRAEAGWPDHWSTRLSVVTGLELLTGIDYWGRVRDRQMLQDYLRRLRAWVRSDGEHHVWHSLRT